MRLDFSIFLKIFQHLVCFILIIIIRLLRPFYLIKFDYSHSERIGHFSGINSIYAATRQKNFKIGNKNNYEFLIHSKIICNSQIEKLLNTKINFFGNFFLPLIKLNSLFPGGKYHLIHYRENYFDKRVIWEHRDINNNIRKYLPRFNFEKEKIKTLKEEVEKYGISEKDKIIILNLRDEGYLKNVFKEKDFSYKTQNVKIDTYFRTVKELTKQGYKVIRAGLNHKNKLNIKSENYIDLFTENIRSDDIEMYLISRCLFQIGSYSGGSMPCFYLFDRPTIITNQIPVIEFHSWSNNVFTIFKNVKDNIRKENISLSEHFELMSTSFGPRFLNGPIDNRYAKKNSEYNIFKEENYKISDFEIIDNNEQEIFDITFEVLNKIENNNTDVKCDESLVFEKIFKKNLNKFPNLWKFHSKNFNSSIGEEFLKSNKNFLK